MGMMVPTRSQAFELLNEYNTNTSLIRHALAVESAEASGLKGDGSERPDTSPTGI